LPWAIAAAALLIYLASLNRWLTFGTLPLAGEIGGWRWQPMLQEPILFLLTWPLRWLPAGWLPQALNVFAAVCASVTLALLARSVALLVQKTPQEQQSGALTSAWLPPLLAAVALALQLTFWENATGAPGEMLQLLLFAAAPWCMLEYRGSSRTSWLDGAAFLYGLGLANSWAMAGFLPLFAAALIWSKPLRFFNVRFLQYIETSAWRKAVPALASDIRFFLRMVLFGLAGLSLILLLPLLAGLSPDSPSSFWQALVDVVRFYGNILWALARAFRYHKEAALLLLTVSFVPVLVVWIRSRLFTGWQPAKGIDAMSLVSHAAYGLLLLLCVMIAFDPPFSPRQLGPRLGVGLPFLPLYYLNALGVGYYSGFFLVLCSEFGSRHRLLPRVLRSAGPGLGYGLLGLMLAGLLWKNLPDILRSNARDLERQYARFIAESLPPEGAVVFGTDPTRLLLVQALLHGEGKAGRYLTVDATAISFERYRAWLRKNNPKRWTAPETPVQASGEGSALDVPGFLRLMFALAQSNRFCCLEANYGPMAEQFFFQPHGLVYELKPYPDDSFDGPSSTSSEWAESEAIWRRVIETGADPLARLRQEVEQPPKSWAGRLRNSARATQSLANARRVLARWYSCALNGWGVLLQRHDQWQAATPCFGTAIALNPENAPARVNLGCNTNRLARKELTFAPPESLEEQIESYRDKWAQSLAADGPVDDPTYCYWIGVACARQNLRRQAGQQLERALALAPKEMSPRVALARLEIICGLPDRALALVTEARTDPQLQPLAPAAKVELSFLEAQAWLAKTNETKAEQILLAVIDANPDDASVRDRVKNTFVAVGSYTNALRMTDQELQLAPNNLQALEQKGLLCTRLGDFSNAVPLFTRALSLTNSFRLWLYRAGAYVQIGQWDKATNDYHSALLASPKSSEPFYGLAEVAWRMHETNIARGYRLQGISNALLVLGDQLRGAPDHVPTLMEKGFLLMQATEFSNAIPAFTRVLELTNSYPGRLNRALAYLQTSQWSAAEEDFRKMLQLFPKAYQPYFGLAEVALRQGNTNGAIRQYQQYLSKAPTNQPEFQEVTARLKSLQTGTP
jgi:tetratricopeptide (TPR) repeat protein